MPRYLLVSQSSIPALQAMWKLACEGTPATFGPLEASEAASPKTAKMQASFFFAKCSLNLAPIENLETNIRWSSYFEEMLFDI